MAPFSERVETASTEFDVLLVGGGLANCCVALALAHFHPTLRVALIERADSLLGNHTWCFHEADFSPRGWSLLQPAVERIWPEYDVRFPGLERRLPSAYGAITSERLAGVVQKACVSRPGFQLMLREGVDQIDPHRVQLASGREVTATWVLDARGPELNTEEARRGLGLPPLFQKFVGLELSLEQPMDHQVPLLMDATVPQLDGFRFMYVLPFDARRVLVEDTYFSDTSTLETDLLRRRILDYAKERGLVVRKIEREETGVLTMPCVSRPLAEPESPLRLGYAGGWFHPTTGYSLPIAARVAEVFASPMSEWRSRLDKLRHTHAEQFRFAAFLNRMLKQGFPPERRWNVFRRFYGFDTAMISRFYALKMTPRDRLRVVCGRPPRGLSLTHWKTGATA